MTGVQNDTLTSETNLARKLMREDERENYGAYVSMGEVDIEAVLEWWEP